VNQAGWGIHSSVTFCGAKSNQKPSGPSLYFQSGCFGVDRLDDGDWIFGSAPNLKTGGSLSFPRELTCFFDGFPHHQKP
jgi:hypothetical protein